MSRAPASAPLVSPSARPFERDRRLASRWLWCPLSVVAAFGACGARCGASGLPDALESELASRAPVVVLGDPAFVSSVESSAEVVGSAAISSAMEGTDEDALVGAMLEVGANAVVVAHARTRDQDGASPTLRDRFARYDAFERFRGVLLTPEAALYELRVGLELDPLLSGAIAHVARALVGGAPVPRVQSFPEPLRRIRNVEVMVLLSDGDQPRLWRSARGSSIARALLTAAVVARQRWAEREGAMGGPLVRLLPTLDVSVHLLEEDGTLTSSSPVFVESVFGPRHGVAFERRSDWRYLLPEATRDRGGGSPLRAYEALFDDADLPPDSLGRPDLRLYRLVSRRIALSPAPARSGSFRSRAEPRATEN